jgi:hypothetical protein
MSAAPSAVSDLTVTVKSREIQRGMLAEMRGDAAAARHFLAAAHLELVLAEDYDAAGERELGRRSRLSAASCFWRAGRVAQARELFAALLQSDPSSASEVQAVQADLEQRYQPTSP